jgi:long-subunit acyl-CoA synthetase (AMP-forming)
MGAMDPASLPPTRIPDVFDATAMAHPEMPALRFHREGEWKALTWREYRAQVRLAARALVRLGVEPGDGVTIIGFNRPEWFIADLAAIHAGAVPAGIYTTSTAEQCAYIAGHCEARVAFVENAEQLAKFLEARPSLPALRAIVLMEGRSEEDAVHDWRGFLELGRGIPEPLLDARIAAQVPDDLCTLVYTSGTTGTPKGVMLTHDNITWTARASGSLLDVRPGDDAISYLPLSHVAEQITTLFGAITFGLCVWFARSMETLGEDLRVVRPAYFLGVPRVWEKIQERMQAAGAAAPPVRRKIVAWARRIGFAGGYADQEGRRRPLLYPVADRLVFAKVRAALGLDRASILVTSAAPIAVHTLEFFLSLGLPICEVYGMSECSGPATVSLPDRYATGAVGVPLPGTEIALAEDGEIRIRGRHVFAGYLRDPEETARTLDADGWVSSGDIGEYDARGFLHITDRKKELIITAGGENVAPQYVEGRLKAIPVVSQAVVIGDRQRHLAALLTLDAAKLPHAAREAGCDACDPHAACRDERFLAYLQRHLDEVNRTLARVQTVKRFAIIPHEFTVEGGELTPTMKLRRRVILEKYRSEIARLYV